MAKTIDDVNSQTITSSPSSRQANFEYNTNGTLLYLGYAYKGKGNSEDVWTIHTYTYDASFRITSVKTAFDSWTNRAYATYE